MFYIILQQTIRKRNEEKDRLYNGIKKKKSI